MKKKNINNEKHSINKCVVIHYIYIYIAKNEKKQT